MDWGGWPQRRKSGAGVQVNNLSGKGFKALPRLETLGLSTFADVVNVPFPYEQ